MKNILHKIICWYLQRCGGVFHCYTYGTYGRYVVVMKEEQYHRYTILAEHDHNGAYWMHLNSQIEAARAEA